MSLEGTDLPRLRLKATSQVLRITPTAEMDNEPGGVEEEAGKAVEEEGVVGVAIKVAEETGLTRIETRVVTPTITGSVDMTRRWLELVGLLDFCQICCIVVSPKCTTVLSQDILTGPWQK